MPHSPHPIPALCQLSRSSPAYCHFQCRALTVLSCLSWPLAEQSAMSLWSSFCSCKCVPSLVDVADENNSSQVEVSLSFPSGGPPPIWGREIGQLDAMFWRSCLPAYLGSQGAPALPHILDVPIPPGLALTYRGMVVAYVEAESPASHPQTCMSREHVPGGP